MPSSARPTKRRLDRFGNSVAISGDTVVVGASLDNLGANTDQGSAYVFIKPTGRWAGAPNETAKLTASDGAGGDNFGFSVAVSGDTVAAGAILDAVDGVGKGSAYVFVKPATGWTSTSTFDAKLTASDGAASDQFGSSVAFSGDTVVVGAWGDAFGAGPFQGSAYVFVQPDNTPPVTSIGVSPMANGNGWHNGTVTFSVSAEDEADGSGVAETRCALDPASAPGNMSQIRCEKCHRQKGTYAYRLNGPWFTTSTAT